MLKKTLVAGMAVCMLAACNNQSANTENKEAETSTTVASNNTLTEQEKKTDGNCCLTATALPAGTSTVETP